MIALQILLLILILLFLVCLVRVRISVTYHEDIRVILKVLIFDFQLLPKKEKPKKEKPKKKEDKKEKKKEPREQEKKVKEKKPNYLAKLKEKKGLSGLISLFKELAKIAGGTLKGLFKHIVIKKLDVGIALNAGDAASTAIQYGQLCSVVYPAVNVITAITVCKDYNVTLEPIFDDDRETEYYADVYAYIRVGFALLQALKAGSRLLIARMKL